MKPNNPLPKSKRAVIQTLLEKTSSVHDLSFEERKEKSRERTIKNDGMQDYYTLRKKWSCFLMWVLGASIFFQFVTVFGIGLKLLDYAKYEWFINLIMGENFLQIIGLCIIVVKFLFPKEFERYVSLQ